MGQFCPWETAQYYIYSSNIPTLFFYSHIPAIFVALLVGFVVFYKSGKSKIGFSLLCVSVLFSLWSIFDLILWATNRPDIVMFFWSLQILFEPLVYLMCFYMVYLFIKNKDLSFNGKTVLLFLYSPAVLLLSSRYNLQGVNLADCTAIEGFLAQYFTYFIETILILSIIFLVIFEARRISNISRKKEILIFGLGVILFLIVFSFGNIIGSFTENWTLAQAGLIGMPIFIVFLGYLIVKYKTFNIKLIATQALVWGLAILIGSQFFFIKVPINFVLNGITFVASIIFGYFLIKSVKKEIEAKENERLQHEKFEELAGRFENINHILAHDIKNTLGKTRDMFAETLAGTFGEITGEGKSFMKRLCRDTWDLITSVTNILKSGDKIVPNPQPFDFKQAVLDAVASIKDKADEEKIKIETQIDEKEDYTVNADRSLIVPHVLKNLLENAINYSSVNGSIWISLSKKDPKTVFLTIKDNGWGMTEDDKKVLFKPGGHGPDSIKKNIHTSGYGLFIAKRTLEVHNGKIYGISEGRNKGSTFFVELPVN